MATTTTINLDTSKDQNIKFENKMENAQQKTKLMRGVKTKRYNKLISSLYRENHLYDMHCEHKKNVNMRIISNHVSLKKQTPKHK
jgi:peroxiredoxin